MPVEAGRNKETNMPTQGKAATLQALLEETIERRDASVLLGLPRLAYEMELHRQCLITMIEQPNGEPIIRLAASFTQFELN
jgi:hypothetical protein